MRPAEVAFALAPIPSLGNAARQWVTMLLTLLALLAFSPASAQPGNAPVQTVWRALSGKLSQAALKPDAENSCRCGGRGGPLGKSCRSEVAHCFPGSEVALDGEGVVDRGVG